MEIMTTNDVYHNETVELSGEDEQTVDKNGLNKSIKITYLTIYSLVFVLGVLGNGVVIWVTGFKMKKTISTVWYLNLAVADFLVAASLPLIIAQTAMDDHWPFGKFMCKLCPTVLFLNSFASVFILMVISVDRCVCVVWPVWAQNHHSVRKASWVSLGVWLLALALSSPHFIFRDTRDNDTTISCNFELDLFGHRAMIITHILMGFVVPFTVIVSCYSVIIYRLRRNRSLASHSGRPLKIIAAVITVFFLCWAPLCIIELFALVGEYLSETVRNVLFNIGLPIATCLAFLNSCLNPLLYMFMGQDFNVFRRSVLKVLEKAFAEELPQTNTSTNAGITSHSKDSFSEAQV